MTTNKLIDIPVNKGIIIRAGFSDFISIDQASGGYPYTVDSFNRATIFDDIPKAAEYMGGPRGLKSYSGAQEIAYISVLKLVGADITNEVMECISLREKYEQELAALNKKYER